MQNTSAETLELDRLIALLGRYVYSPQGKAELDAIAPHNDRPRLEEDLAEAGEAIQYLRAAGRPQPAARGAAIRLDFGGIPDLAETVHKLRIERTTFLIGEDGKIEKIYSKVKPAGHAAQVLSAL